MDLKTHNNMNTCSRLAVDIGRARFAGEGAAGVDIASCGTVSDHSDMEYIAD